jgi:hypothetical protein
MLDFIKNKIWAFVDPKKKGTNLYFFAPFKGEKIKFSSATFYQSQFLAR